ncbi:MAG: STAS domain-containing protein [Gammaproteobacteria bacterium]|nr:STAS domain-containing protein [Gammaproteobacteria bacterium]
MSEEPLETAAEGHEFRITCDEILDISSAGTFRDQLVQALVSERPVVLDAEHVERVDTAVLQVLGAFFHDAGAHDQMARWHKPSRNLQQAAALLGMQGILGLAGEHSAGSER